ncbi:hypothetical protein SDC9_08640 [bioreactor metagenome]|uniref:SF3 helicase domain-containing protein n=2 Tax=root TaxID=1 RepID=A0A644T868_9ZZZZ
MDFLDSEISKVPNNLNLPDFFELILDIINIIEGISSNNTSNYPEGDPIYNLIEDAREIFTLSEFDLLIEKIRNNYKNRKNIAKSNMILAKLLSNKENVILRKDYGTIYKLDRESNGYKNITLDDLKRIVDKLIDDKEYVNIKDINTALSHIGNRLSPQYDFIRFKNGIYDMNKMKFIKKPKKPIFSLIEVDHKYKNNIKDNTIIDDYLKTSLKRGSSKLTDDYIKGLKEIIGYLFTSGNKEEILIFIVGIGGSGKSLLVNILSLIFGSHKIADLKIRDMNTSHGTSSLVGKQINIVRDSDDALVENMAILKQLSGNDDLQVNPKNKPHTIIPNKEVAKIIIMANEIPVFKKLDDAFIDRLVFIEFLHKFRGTSEENKNILSSITNNDKAIQKLIFESLMAYKAKKSRDRDFILKKSLNETKLLLQKHTTPLNFLISKLISGFDINSTDKIYVRDLRDLLKKLANSEGVELSYNSEGDIDGRLISKAIKSTFDLDFKIDNQVYGTKVDYKKSKRYYPYLCKNYELWDFLKND